MAALHVSDMKALSKKLNAEGYFKWQNTAEEHYSRHESTELHELYYAVEREFNHVLEIWRTVLTQSVLETYFQLHDVLLEFVHWKDDVTVKHETDFNPLSGIGSSKRPVYVALAGRLRGEFINILKALSLITSKDSSLQSIETNGHLVEEIARLTRGLRPLVGPLRTFAAIKDLDEESGVRPESALGVLQAARDGFDIVQKSRLSDYKWFEKSRFSGVHDFAPNGCVKKCLTDEAIKSELGFWSKSEEWGERHEHLVPFIRTEAPLFFAILVCIRYPRNKLIRAMSTLEKSEPQITDKYLPITPHDAVDESTSGSLLTKLDPRGALWDQHTRKAFYMTQWKFLAPVFSTGDLSKDLDPREILPITVMEKKPGAVGGFGEVFRAQIHPAHINDSGSTLGVPQPPTVVAIKKSHAGAVTSRDFNRTEQDDKIVEVWRNEANEMRRVNKLKRGSDHILRFITAFRREGDGGQEHFYLISEWADGGNLLDFWKRQYNPILNATLVREVVTQLYGISEALVAAHYESGEIFIRHGDIKPENILCFLRPGSPVPQLKIGDWGLAKAKNKTEQVTGAAVTNTGVATVMYEPPEAVTTTPNGPNYNRRLSRKKDVWAMGCIILEFMTWMLGGYEGYNAFRLAMKPRQGDVPQQFFKWKQPDNLGSKVVPVIHDPVERIMNDIEKDSRCPPPSALADLVRFTKTRLLVLKLEIKPLGRIESHKITDHSELESSNGGDDDTHSHYESPPHSRPATPSPQQIPHQQPIPGVSVADFAPKIHVDDASSDQLASQPVIADIQPPRERESRSLQQPSTLVDTYQSEDLLRADSAELSRELKRIISRGDADAGYWTVETPVSGPQRTFQNLGSSSKAEQQGGNTESGYYTSSAPQLPTNIPDKSSAPQDARDPSRLLPSITKGDSLKGVHPIQTGSEMDYGHANVTNKWEFSLDNKFAHKAIASLTDMASLFPRNHNTSLCGICEKLKIWESAFTVDLDVGYVKMGKDGCNLCKLFWKACVDARAYNSNTVTFTRMKSWLTIPGLETPLLSLYRHPDDKNPPKDLSLGLPLLPRHDSPARFSIMRRWLDGCDARHAHDAVKQSSSWQGSFGGNFSETAEDFLPRRLIDVNSFSKDHVRLWRPSSGAKGKYIALSHPWGAGPYFRTLKNTVSRYETEGIPLAELPATFSHAVSVTRALEYQYLWIDSICLVQDDPVSLAAEIKDMELVFSSASCVIAASCSAGQRDGFLWPRANRMCVAIERPRSSFPMYVCDAIDDFEGDVLGSVLSSRGWVLQERALARRTIFFTENQTYFECGKGVRCETLMSMNNSLGDLLGDSNFPTLIMKAERGEIIVRYQDLYRQYCRLNVSVPSDRAIAMNGLQSRLLKAFNTKGDFGIVGSSRYFGRSLLWIRHKDQDSMEHIEFPEGQHKMPSWSWMAYMGAIDYVNFPFASVKWEHTVEEPDWEEGPGHRACVFRGPSYRFSLRKTAAGLESQLFFERPGEESNETLRCIILGRDILPSMADDDPRRRCYVLVVVPISEARNAWRRIGAGYVPWRSLSGSEELVVVE